MLIPIEMPTPNCFDRMNEPPNVYRSSVSIACTSTVPPVTWAAVAIHARVSVWKTPTVMLAVIPRSDANAPT